MFHRAGVTGRDYFALPRRLPFTPQTVDEWSEIVGKCTPPPPDKYEFYGNRV